MVGSKRLQGEVPNSAFLSSTNPSLSLISAHFLMNTLDNPINNGVTFGAASGIVVQVGNLSE
jgi:hypothetical protein